MTILIVLITAVLWIGKCGYEFGKSVAEEEARNRRPPPEPIIQDRPQEQAGFVMLHDNFIHSEAKSE